MNADNRRLSVLEIIRRAEARERRDKWIALGVLVGVIVSILALVMVIHS